MASGLLIDRRFDSNDMSVQCKSGDELIKRKKPKNINIQPFLTNIFQLHSNAARIYDYCVVQQNFHFSTQAQSELWLCNRAKFRKFRTQLIIRKKNRGETLSRAPSGPE